MSAQETRKKTLKIKKPSTAGPRPTLSTTSPPSPPPAAGPQPVGAPTTLGVSQPIKPDILSFILALVATLLFFGVVALQWMEISYYSSPPTVWPGA